MPLKISEIGKLLKALNRFENIGEFNSRLPVRIEIKKQINEFNYLINLGNKKEIVTKSFVKLNPGKYFALIKEKGLNIQITNLKKIPQLFTIFEKTNLKENHFSKETILNHLSNATNKTEFIFFTNLFIAVQKKIFHLAINEKRKALLQYKYQKNKLHFFAVFNHLGEIEGKIFANKLIIFSPYKNTINLIKQNKNSLNLTIETHLKTDIKPLYEFSENLFNLKA